jgi:hypothetical protein
MNSDEEMAAAFDALDTITKTLDRHWMRKPQDGAPVEEDPGLSLEIEVEGDPSEDIEELAPGGDVAPAPTEEPLRVTEYMGPRKGAPSAPPPPQEPVKRKRGRPPKVR